MGHRLERPVRNYLESHYGIYRYPAIFVEREPFADFESAVCDASPADQAFFVSRARDGRLLSIVTARTELQTARLQQRVQAIEQCDSHLHEVFLRAVIADDSFSKETRGTTQQPV